MHLLLSASWQDWLIFIDSRHGAEKRGQGLFGRLEKAAGRSLNGRTVPEIDWRLLGNLYWLGEVCKHVTQLLFHLSGGNHCPYDEPTIGGEGRALPELSQRAIKGLALIGGIETLKTGL